MKKLRNFFLCFIKWLFNSRPKNKTIFYPAYVLTDFDCELLYYVNQSRTIINSKNPVALEKLVFLPLLNNVAKSQADYIASIAPLYPIAKDLAPFMHFNFNERSEQINLKLGKCTVAENCGGGYINANGLAHSFVNSPGHYKNIIGDFTHTGIATAIDTNGRKWTCQLFYKDLK